MILASDRPWWDQIVHDDLASISLIVVSVVTAIWAVTMLMNVMRYKDWSLLSWRFWFSMFLLVAVSGLYSILAWSVIRSPSGIPVWGLLYIVGCGIITFVAFLAWAREDISS